jgi:hypothetical protein
MRERVLERVFEISEEALSQRNSAAWRWASLRRRSSSASLGNGEHERERHVLADDRGCLEQPLVPR